MLPYFCGCYQLRFFEDSFVGYFVHYFPASNMSQRSSCCAWEQIYIVIWYIIVLRLSSRISITSCTSGVKIVGIRFLLFPVEYISSKRVASSFSRGSSKLSTSSCLFQSLRLSHCSIVNFAASPLHRALKVIILTRTSF